jgi:hypothetical protein
VVVVPIPIEVELIRVLPTVILPAVTAPEEVTLVADKAPALPVTLISPAKVTVETPASASILLTTILLVILLSTLLEL